MLVLKLPKRRKVPKRIREAWLKAQERKRLKASKRVDYVQQYADKMASRAKWTAFYASKGKRSKGGDTRASALASSSTKPTSDESRGAVAGPHKPSRGDAR